MQGPGRSSEGCCSCKVAVCTLFLLVLCIVVAGLAVFTYRMNKDLQELKSKTGAGKNKEMFFRFFFGSDVKPAVSVSVSVSDLYLFAIFTI